MTAHACLLLRALHFGIRFVNVSRGLPNYWGVFFVGEGGLGVWGIGVQGSRSSKCGAAQKVLWACGLRASLGIPSCLPPDTEQP